ncbi:DUF5134 domain-containing protein [Streptomyces sp. BE20]|uniref:DUF5134 domain-containing protein n=1 Tax=Streptomyces sp. BE20 TaxID=3002525 RepID=UPI002E7A3220|nr:DUF5134 domain-containing protein [Streptomyces sp. BE20]MEE1824365.1 DUF5134 domain-containing protein [Streptomyces sp. BE20]
MHGSALVSWLLAALAAASGGYCLTRLRRTPPAPPPGAAEAGTAPRTPGPRRTGATGATRAHRLHAYESDASEALMGFGMAAMAVTGTAVPGVAWAWLFGPPAVALLLAAAYRPERRAHRLHHAVGALSMTYMALVMATAPAAGHAGHHPSAAGSPALTGALLLYFGGYALWSGSRLLSGAGGGPGGLPAASATLPRAWRLSMGIGMFAMLLTM